MPEYVPGQEPEEIKEKISLLFSDIEKTFPDRTIIWSQWNHDRWDKAAGYLCSWLGYNKGSDFLKAYGYNIVNEEKSPAVTEQKQPQAPKEKKVSKPKPAEAEEPLKEESPKLRDPKFDIPIWEKYVLTVQEAAAYFRIGENKLRQIVADNPRADYLLWNGNRPQFKRRMFEKYVDGLNEV